MFEFKGLIAAASVIGLLAVHRSDTHGSADRRQVRSSEIAFRSTFKGVEADGETLVWSSDGPASGPALTLRIVPMSSAASAAESVWPVRAILIARDSRGTPMESTMYGIIDWSKQELRLHGNCVGGVQAGSSVSAIGTFSHMDVTGTVEVLPLTASR
ncbi:MAG TPA: hypothetical protein VGJ12_05075 [Gemmatimonadaceae bacterium]